MACTVHARFGSMESGDVTLMYLTDAAPDSSWSSFRSHNLCL